MNKMFLGFWNRSVILTYLELCIAVGGICMAAEGRFRPAVAALAVCGVCDVFDGKIARATKRSKDACTFGIQIDSLCDAVSFGALPSAIGHSAGIRGVGILALMLYTLCAIIRLGYFNVTEQKRQELTSENRTEFEGLPVTWSAVIVPIGSLLRPAAPGAFAWIYTALLLVMAFFFLVRIRVAKPQI